ncbi:MAG TPA: dihydroorotate dehydrogenase electron transfer subunit [bacterium]|nr:dihydroorotate dehydrogenase electron transfer subunit [bacterium]HPP29681.1 dihydroorotate dehydrogenase electron transfer subunit [bacterium]
MEAKKFRIKENIHLTEKLYLLELEGNLKTSPSPGQFVHIKIEPFFLRRPFSVAGYRDNCLKLLYRVAGRATEALTGKQAGEFIDVIGPLGNGFPVSDKWEKIYLAGGGTGIAPLLFLSEFLVKKDITFFYGARSIDCIAFNILTYGVNYIFSTDDGSYGHKGLLPDVIKRYIKKDCLPDVIYAGGPYEMLKAIDRISQNYKIPAFVSMENRMACGTGLCYGCVTKIKNKKGWEYKRVCKDGPVFSSEEVLWE